MTKTKIIDEKEIILGGEKAIVRLLKIKANMWNFSSGNKQITTFKITGQFKESKKIDLLKNRLKNKYGK